MKPEKHELMFSIIIPTLNEEKFLPHLLSDLVKQSKRSYEVIIVDGNSQDKTLKKAETFRPKLPRLKILVSTKRNVSVQRNQGVKLAEADYLIFMDADTRIPTHFMKKLKKRLTDKPVDLFSSWCIPDTHSKIEKAICNTINLSLEAGKLLNIPGGLGAMIGCKRSDFAKIGRFNPKIPFGEDSEFIRRAKKKGFRFELFRRPKYIFSLRRYRKNGYLGGIKDYAQLRLQLLTSRNSQKLKIDYPMGGHIYKSSLKPKTKN